jgi:proline iminopeptidase
MVAVAASACAAPTPGAGRAAATAARDVRVAVAGASLYARDVGRGQPIVVLHGGPDFDHSYFLPEMDRLADGYRLIYYDQRGRGRSAENVNPDEVSLASEMADLDAVRQSFHLDTVAILGHSWGSVLALEYAIRNPSRVSHLLLMNPAPSSEAEYALLRKVRVKTLGPALDRLNAIAATDAWKAGDPDAVAAAYRIHFTPAFERPADLDTIVARLRASFAAPGVLKARRIEDRLRQDTWLSPGYDLLPRVAALRVPALVVFGDHDFIPFETADHLVHAISGARLATMAHCGHFSYMECPDQVRRAVDDFFRSTTAAASPGRQ